MHDTKPGLTRPRSLLPCQVAMHRWEAEGGALAQRATQQAPRRDLASLAPGEAVARLTQLHIRVIALENMVISLLAQASDRQLDIAREMAIFISRASILRPKNSGVRPTISPDINTAMMIKM